LLKGLPSSFDSIKQSLGLRDSTLSDTFDAIVTHLVDHQERLHGDPERSLIRSVHHHGMLLLLLLHALLLKSLCEVEWSGRVDDACGRDWPTATRRDGCSIASWRDGSTVAWRDGSTAAWRNGSTATWRSGAGNDGTWDRCSGATIAWDGCGCGAPWRDGATTDTYTRHRWDDRCCGCGGTCCA
jgi:hypothetical protein